MNQILHEVPQIAGQKPTLLQKIGDRIMANMIQVVSKVGAGVVRRSTQELLHVLGFSDHGVILPQGRRESQSRRVLLPKRKSQDPIRKAQRL